MKIVAILSTTVLPLDGTYTVKTTNNGSPEQNNERLEILQSLIGVNHYIGHPDTKAIVEGLGGIQSPCKLFTGLQIGQSAICFPIKQGLSSRSAEGFTLHQAITEMDTLDVKILTRIA